MSQKPFLSLGGLMVPWLLFVSNQLRHKTMYLETMYYHCRTLRTKERDMKLNQTQSPHFLVLGVNSELQSDSKSCHPIPKYR